MLHARVEERWKRGHRPLLFSSGPDESGKLIWKPGDRSRRPITRPQNYRAAGDALINETSAGPLSTRRFISYTLLVKSPSNRSNRFSNREEARHPLRHARCLWRAALNEQYKRWKVHVVHYTRLSWRILGWFKLRFCRCVCDCDAGLLFRDYDDEACRGMKLSLKICRERELKI